MGKTYIHKGVTVRFGFDVQRTSQLHQYVKNKATGTPHGDVVIYSPLWLWTCLRLEPREFIYICISVGLSALVHSKITILICYLLDYQQVRENTNVSIILLGDKKEPTK